MYQGLGILEELVLGGDNCFFVWFCGLIVGFLGLIREGCVIGSVRLNFAVFCRGMGALGWSVM